MPAPRPVLVNGLALGNGDQPGLYVGRGIHRRVGAQRSQEGLRPSILCLVVAQDRAADPQHRWPVLRDDVLERDQNRHGWVTRDGFSKASRNSLRCRPPAYPVNDPSAPITRWQGTTMPIGLRAL